VPDAPTEEARQDDAGKGARRRADGRRDPSAGLRYHHAAHPEAQARELFAAWLDGLTDLKGRARIQLRIDRLALGTPVM
jgi:hypothetical protein